jgi:uncharacterized protein (DUF2141 family)
MMGPNARSVSPSSSLRPALVGALVALALGFAGTPQALRAEPTGAACAAAALATAEAPATNPPSIEVTVENVRSSKGLITAVLYGDDPDTFLKRGARLDRIRVDAQEGETVLCLKAPATGRYTVALYHDENGNKEFDRNFLGIPSEGYGFSNNPGFRFGKPEQEETLFTIQTPLTALRISVLYL